VNGRHVDGRNVGKIEVSKSRSKAAQALGENALTGSETEPHMTGRTLAKPAKTAGHDGNPAFALDAINKHLNTLA
jgi:hypothetical protein